MSDAKNGLVPTGRKDYGLTPEWKDGDWISFSVPPRLFTPFQSVTVHLWPNPKRTLFIEGASRVQKWFDWTAGPGWILSYRNNRLYRSQGPQDPGRQPALIISPDQDGYWEVEPLASGQLRGVRFVL